MTGEHETVLVLNSGSSSLKYAAFALAETFEQTSFLLGMTIAGGMVGWVGPRATYLLPGALLLAAAAMARRIEPTISRQADVSEASGAARMVAA